MWTWTVMQCAWLWLTMTDPTTHADHHREEIRSDGDDDAADSDQDIDSTDIETEEMEDDDSDTPVTADGGRQMSDTEPRQTHGQKVSDRHQGRQEGEAYIVGVTDKRADEYHIEAIGKTVAECNHQYPNSDRVVEVVFADELDSQEIGLMQKDASMTTSQGGEFGSVFAQTLRNHADTTVYSYPESRLEVV